MKRKNPWIWEEGQMPLSRFEGYRVGLMLALGMAVWVCIVVKACL